ncbi:MAG: MATE family efflux transporter [Clostridia bacterium]|nr:MATE family efflux transporter [Clostridia bacterium]MBQ5488245.1 MATE family efflux transporter [Clostridia bacterium]
MEKPCVKTDTKDLTSGSVGGKLMLFFLPILAGTWFQQLYNAVDAIIVGRYVGHEALAAVGGSVATILNLFIGFFVALSTGASVIISHIFGAKQDDDELASATGTAVAFSIIAGAAFSVICFILTPQFLVWMKTPTDTLADATLYLRLCFAAMAVVLLLNTESAILRAVGDSRRPFIFMLISCLLNIALDWLFVVRFSWGVAGVAWATVISQVVNCILLTVTMLVTRQPYRLRLSRVRISGAIFRRMMSIGLPSGLEASMYSVSNIVLQVAVNALGTVVVASWSLSGKLDGFYWGMAQAANAAVITFVGQNYGAGRLDRIRGSVKTALKLFIGMTVVMSAAIILSAPAALKIFTTEPAVRSTTYTIILYFVPFYFIWTAFEVLSGTLRGCGDTRPVLITGVGICAFRILWVLIVYRLWPTLFTVSISYLISWTLTLAAIIIYYRSGKWERKDVLRP